MAKMTKSLEVLPVFPFELITGALNDCSFRVTKTGRNIVSAKVTSKGKKGGRDAVVVKSASLKWRSLEKFQKDYWQDIAYKKSFYSCWTAFCSSFFLSVDEYGLEYTMENELQYIYSKNRLKRYQHFANSSKRWARYRVNPEDYVVTAETLKQYPIRFFNEIIFIKLLDLEDVNLALNMKMAERTDSIVEYDYYPDANSDGNSGRYIRKERARAGKELYEPIVESNTP